MAREFLLKIDTSLAIATSGLRTNLLLKNPPSENPPSDFPKKLFQKYLLRTHVHEIFSNVSLLCVFCPVAFFVFGDRMKANGVISGQRSGVTHKFPMSHNPDTKGKRTSCERVVITDRQDLLEVH